MSTIRINNRNWNETNFRIWPQLLNPKPIRSTIFSKPPNTNPLRQDTQELHHSEWNPSPTTDELPSWTNFLWPFKENRKLYNCKRRLSSWLHELPRIPLRRVQYNLKCSPFFQILTLLFITKQLPGSLTKLISKLGSTNSSSNNVRLKPFSASTFKFLFE